MRIPNFVPGQKALPPAKSNRAAMDGRDRLLLPLTWLLGILLVQLLSGFMDYGLPGLGLTLFIVACYAVLFWYAGPRKAFSRQNLPLLIGQGLLTLSFLLFADYQLRLLN